MGGGGIYELDEFYDVADELGILIWQDFMFACSMYPADPETLANVEKEVTHQVRRLQHHASLALWAGNNENEAALRQNWYQTDSLFETYKEDYISLYVDTIKKTAVKEDPSRFFVVSSPSNGVASEEAGYIAENPQSSLWGDTHHYDYKSNNWDWQNYPKTRFASEYGFQAFPAFSVLEPVSELWDWSVGSAWMKHRQHHPNGNMELLWQIGLNMNLDAETLDTVDGFKEFLYLTQVQQAVALKTESETYRRGMVSADPDTGEGLTMGALYWQLNDIWQGASWTSLEHGGQWKMSHYYAKRFFAPILVSPIISGDNLEVWAVCDSSTGPLSLQTTRLHWTSFNQTNSSKLPMPGCPSPGAHLQLTEPMESFLSWGECHPGSYDMQRLSYCFFSFQLLGDQGHVLSQNSLFAAPNSLRDPDFGLQEPNIRVSGIERINNILEGPYVESYSIKVRADFPAIFVWLEAAGISGRFNDNGFHQITAEQEVIFQAKEPTSVAQLEEILSVRTYTVAPCTSPCL